MGGYPHCQLCYQGIRKEIRCITLLCRIPNARRIGKLWPTNPILKAGQTGPLPRRTSQRPCCHTPPFPTGNINLSISSMISGGDWKRQSSHFHQSTASGQVIWMYQASSRFRMSILLHTDPDFGQYRHFWGTIINVCMYRNPNIVGTHH